MSKYKDNYIPGSMSFAAGFMDPRGDAGFCMNFKKQWGFVDGDMCWAFNGDPNENDDDGGERARQCLKEINN